MKALSVRQPWASLIATGRKTIEVRTWSTRHRGKLLICASKFVYKKPPIHVRSGFELLADIEEPIIRGEALCVADLVDVRPAKLPDDQMESLAPMELTHFSWEVRVLKKVQPMPVRGRLGLFEVTSSACPKCSAIGHTCNTCELYYCNRCDLWVPWAFGAADDLYALCDDCWVDVERKAS